jgi:hypothetical protein
MYGILLSLHIAGGSIALVTAAIALATSKGTRRHVYAGRVFSLGMLAVFLTALPMTVLKPNLFLLLIALFSFYLVLTGWLRARDRSGTPGRADWIAPIAMVVTAVAMAVRAIGLMRAGDSMGIVLIVFGAIGGALAAGDLVGLRTRRHRGVERIAAHLTRMLAGTIAAVTAFTVVNVKLHPAFVVWLAPTVLLAPVIVYWNVRVRRGATSRGAPRRGPDG